MNETTSDVRVFRLNERAYSGLLFQLERLNKRAAKLGVTPVTVKQLEPWSVQTREDGEEISCLRWARFEVSMIIPRLPGWRFLATIEHLDGGNVIRKCPAVGDDVDLSEYREGPARCEHCNTVRRRHDSFVIEHESGCRKQVGRDCLAEVLGLGLTPESVASQAEWLTSLGTLIFQLGGSCGGSDPDSGWEGFGRVPETYDVHSFLTVCAALIRVDGYRSNKVAKEDVGLTSTSSNALFHIRPPSRMSARSHNALVDRYGSFPIQPTDDDVAMASSAQTWALEIEPRSDFDHNLRLVARQTSIGTRDLGIAAYIVRGFQRAREIEVERKAARPESQHVGEVGKRLRGQAVVFLGTPFSTETEFGPLFIHRFATAEGSDLTWKTSTAIDLEPGTKAVATFTVKAHEDFKGRPQTVITRVKLA